MPDYQALYFSLFNTITDAVEQIDRRNYGTARDLLVQGQMNTEEQYISEEDHAARP